MLLSKLNPNPQNRQARRDMGNPHHLHRTIMRAFPTPLPQEERVLFRVETADSDAFPLVLVQSQHMPDWQAVENAHKHYFETPPKVKTLDKLHIKNGVIYRFRLRANACKRVLYKESGQSQRISLFSETDRREWLKRKASQCGFTLIDERLIVKDAPFRTFFISQEEAVKRATLNMVDYEGLLRVEDTALLLHAMRSGIGPAKGLGCGLLSLAPA